MSEAPEIIRWHNTVQRHCQEVAGREMTAAVCALSRATFATKATDRRAWLAEIEHLAFEAKRIRDAIYKEQGALQNV